MVHLSATLLVALGSVSCAGAAQPPARAPEGAEGLTSIGRLVDERQSYEGRRATVRGFVVPGPGGCLDMVCDNIRAVRRASFVVLYPAITARPPIARRVFAATAEGGAVMGGPELD